MLPLITSAEQVKECLSIIEEVKNELSAEDISFNKDVPVGIMIETAAAAITSDCLSKVSDFFSNLYFSYLKNSEINPFVLAIYNVGGPGQEIEKRHQKAIDKIDKNVNLKVCVTLACHYCAQEVMHCQRIASLNDNVQAEMIDATLFKDLVDKYKIERIPLLIVNDEKTFVGQKNMDEILDIIKACAK